jgi:hypothetical protein
MMGNLLAGRVSTHTSTGAALCGLRGVNAAFFVAAWIQLAVLLVAWRCVAEPPPAPPEA